MHGDDEITGGSSVPPDAGFSLIELLLVVVILGIVSTVVALSVGGIGAEAEDSACLADRRLLETAGEAYFAQRHADGIPPSLAVAADHYEQTLVDEGFLRGASSYYDLDAMGHLVEVAGSPCTI